MKFYDNPITVTYTVINHPVDGAGTTALLFRGPPGARGVLRQLSLVIRTATTTGTGLLRLGITGTLARFASLVIPVGAALVAAQLGKGAMDNIYIDADTNILINDDGVPATGDVDITCVIDWERLGPR